LASVKVNAKELKRVLKILNIFAGHAQLKAETVAAMAVVDNTLSIAVQTDNCLVVAQPKAIVLSPGEMYSFYPALLLDLAINDGDVTLSWQDKTSKLQIQKGTFNSQLNVAAPKAPEFNMKAPSKLVQVPVGVLASITKQLKMPYAYYAGKRDLAPVWLKKSERGWLEALADDSYSLGKVETSLSLPWDLDLKVPAYVMETLYSSYDHNDDTIVQIGYENDTAMLQAPGLYVVTRGMTDGVLDFDGIFRQIKNWRTSCTFDSKDLLDSVKPLHSIIPAKDKSGVVIKCLFAQAKMALSLHHKDVGEAAVSAVPGVKDVVNEGGVSDFTLNMQPQAFHDFTSLISANGVRMLADNGTVFYHASKRACGHGLEVKYLFPTVSV
jgi:hypothetical protein